MARVYQFTAGPAEAGQRLDRFLVRHLPSTLSRTVIQRGIAQGIVTINEQPAKAHRALRQGDVVRVRCEWLAAEPNQVLKPQPIPLEIVYEDAQLLVVNKPPGLVTHPAPGHWDGTLVNAILWHWGAGGGEPALQRAGIVHRLDKDTSGLLLVAKTVRAHTMLSRQLKDRTMSRGYVALAEGELPYNEGTIRAAIGRHHVHRKVMAVQYLGGRAAVSHYRVVKRVSAEALTPDIHRPLPLHAYSILDISLETGRTHQIRVHLAHIGHPVVGDITYGHRPVSFWAAMGVSRQMLHAYRLQFRHPATGQPVLLIAPVPPDMQPWLGNLDVGAWAVRRPGRPGRVHH